TLRSLLLLYKSTEVYLPAGFLQFLHPASTEKSYCSVNRLVFYLQFTDQELMLQNTLFTVKKFNISYLGMIYFSDKNVVYHCFTAAGLVGHFFLFSLSNH